MEPRRLVNSTLTSCMRKSALRNLTSEAHNFINVTTKGKETATTSQM